MGEVYRFLGLTVGCIQHDQDPATRRAMYECDITYGTNSEFGFDYLRDNGMATSAEEQVQRGHNFAIVDEVDSILIDEARTPLIISGPTTVQRDQQYDRYKPAIERLVRQQAERVNAIANDGFRLFEESKQARAANDRRRADELLREAGAKFYRVRVGMPKHKQLMRAMEDADLRKAIEDFELQLYADTRREELYRIKEELLFAIDEKGSESDLSSQGREFLSPNEPDAFVVPDLLTLLHDVRENTSLTPEQKHLETQRLQQHFDESTERIHTINQLLKAYCTLDRDVNYVVQDNKVLIVDEHTGRALPGRRWSDGLHQAVEAKEGVQIDRETQTYATITIQNYFRLYGKLAGMTGTAETEANEFHDIYRLDVVVIPPNRPCLRDDGNDAIYKSRREKYTAVLREINERHKAGQPLLIGTASVESSEVLSRMLKRENIPHAVLNAKFHEQEAEIVARAGQKGAVTIATNMAGRGTDIKLGDGVAALGGLRVIGTERHESRRIDRQLRGRCARQGDPGSSRFYISFEDDLMRNFADSRKLAALMTRFGMKDDEELESPLLNRSVEGAQKRVEQRNYMIRKHTLQYDDVLNNQRTVIYDFRNEILHAENPRPQLLEVVADVVQQQAQKSFAAGSDREEYLGWANTTFPVQLTAEEISACDTADALAKTTLDRVQSAYGLKTQFEEPAAITFLERYMMLSAVDRFWQEHLYAMDGLRQGISLRAYGQKDPLVEYKQEAFNMFDEMMVRIKQQIAENVFRSASSLTAFEQFLHALPTRAVHESLPGMAGIRGELPAPAPKPAVTEAANEEITQALADSNQPVKRNVPKVGRNDPCPCGSGKKYKSCCGAS
jgi:preprotein translocase subunit SecA